MRQRLEARGCSNRSRVTWMQFTTAKSIVLRSFSFDSLLIRSSLALLAGLLTLEGLLIKLGMIHYQFCRKNPILFVLFVLSRVQAQNCKKHCVAVIFFQFFADPVLSCSFSRAT